MVLPLMRPSVLTLREGRPDTREQQKSSQAIKCISWNCAVPENIYTLPTKGTGISWGWGLCKAKKCKEMYEASLEFPEG